MVYPSKLPCSFIHSSAQKNRMEFLPEDISDYVEAHTTPETEFLNHLNRETWQKMLQPRMLSGHLQGRVLSMISHMVQPERILEIGTFTGYSAICLAEGLRPNGKVTTIEIDEELRKFIENTISKSGYKENIELIIGNALEVINDLKDTFDIVFIDADKGNYINYYNIVFDKVKRGGYLIADNVLWSGKVLKDDQDEETETLKEYSDMVQNDQRVENVLFPVRDGLMICRKK